MKLFFVQVAILLFILFGVLTAGHVLKGLRATAENVPFAIFVMAPVFVSFIGLFVCIFKRK